MMDHILAQMPMMMLGRFLFAISTATYQDLTRKTGRRWAQQDVYGKRPVLQDTGPDAETITLAGVIFPEYRGGFRQLDDLRALMNTGKPQALLTGSGQLLGKWVIESVEERQSTFAALGAPRRQDFTLQLKRFS
jgi:phage protein U